MVKLIADSTCDFSKELAIKYNVEIIPLNILLGENEYQDGENITPDEIYKWSDENKQTPKTSAISFDRIMEAFERNTADGSEVICFSISDAMSTTGNVMRMAAEELGLSDKIYVVDSQNITLGIGMLLIEASKMVSEGKSAAEIVAKIEELKPLTRVSFVVDTLTYLHRGGRCSGVAALAGGVLKLHPKIVVENGKMRPDKKYRGKTPVAIEAYVKDMEEELKNANHERVFIVHSGCAPTTINSVNEYVKKLGLFREIIILRAGSVISSHCGPGTLGVLFMASK